MFSERSRVWYIFSATFFTCVLLGIATIWIVYNKYDDVSGTLIGMTLVSFIFAMFSLLAALDRDDRLSGLNLRIGRVSRIFGGFDWCKKCKTTWMFVESHDTAYTPNQLCFVLCKKCWSELTPEERIPYYQELFGHTYQWSLIEQAVLEGK